MERRERLIRAYFDAWVKKDAAALEETFDENIVYSECYGPVYIGLAQVRRWFEDWNQKGSVLEWRIRRFFHAGGSTVVDWHFCCDWDGGVSAFDGVSIVDFGPEGRIIRLREFESKSEHVYPYGREDA